MLRLRRYRVLFLALLVIVGTCAAQVPSATQADVKPRRLLMWKASSPTTTVYLLGSIHLGDKNLYPLPDAVEAAFNTSKLLVVEVNVKNMGTIAAMKLMQQYGFYHEDDGLSKHLPKNLADALDDFCKRHHLPRSLLEQFKPWAVAATIEALTLQQAGEDLSLGVDLHFLNESKPPQQIEELETAEFQMTVLSSATENEQQEELADTLKEMDDAKEHFRRMREAFLSGDPAALQKFVEEHSSPRSLYKRLVDDRNGPMAARIDGYLKKKDQCFVVVGAAHLIGDHGVVKLLQEKNYKVDLITAGMK